MERGEMYHVFHLTAILSILLLLILAGVNYATPSLMYAQTGRSFKRLTVIVLLVDLESPGWLALVSADPHPSPAAPRI